MAGGAVVERDVLPVGRYRMPYPGRDGVLLRRGAVLERLVHVGGEPVVTRAWAAANRVRIRAEAHSRDGALAAIERMRFALGTDHDLSEFHLRFRRDPLVGPVIRAKPWLRPRRRPEPFEALVWAISEQLIESGRAASIQRRLVWRLGRTSACGTPARPALAGAPGRPLAGRARGLRARRQAGPGHDPGRARGQPRAGWISRPTSRAGGACSRSRTSAPGRWSRSPSTARGATTSCPPATSPT